MNTGSIDALIFCMNKTDLLSGSSNHGWTTPSVELAVWTVREAQGRRATPNAATINNDMTPIQYSCCESLAERDFGSDVRLRQHVLSQYVCVCMLSFRASEVFFLREGDARKIQSPTKQIQIQLMSICLYFRVLCISFPPSGGWRLETPITNKANQI